jgi:hypothetical protein
MTLYDRDYNVVAVLDFALSSKPGRFQSRFVAHGMGQMAGQFGDGIVIIDLSADVDFHFDRARSKSSAAQFASRLMQSINT